MWGYGKTTEAIIYQLSIQSACFMTKSWGFNKAFTIGDFEGPDVSHSTAHHMSLMAASSSFDTILLRQVIRAGTY